MLITPQIPSFLPFDATKDYELNFNIPSYSDQCVKNQIQIFKQSDSTLVYNSITTSFQLFCPIPMNTLMNGINYQCQIRTYNINNDISDWSVMTFFLVLSPVTLTLFIPNIILSQSLILNATYSQLEFESILSSKFILYDSQKNQISISEEIFGLPIQYQFDLLENNTNYFVTCESISQNGLLGDTGYIGFMTQFQTPRINNVLQLTNQHQDAAVLASCEIVRVLGHGVGSYFYEDSEWINLTVADSMVYFDDANGFKMDSDFILKVWCKGVVEDKVIISIYGYNSLDKIEVQYYNNRFHAFKKSCGLVNHYASNELIVLPTDNVFMFLKQTNIGIDVKTEIISGLVL